jgi:hypothetical protein
MRQTSRGPISDAPTFSLRYALYAVVSSALYLGRDDELVHATLSCQERSVLMVQG